MKIIDDAENAYQNGETVNWIDILHKIEHTGSDIAIEYQDRGPSLAKQTFLYFKEQYQNIIDNPEEEEIDCINRYIAKSHHNAKF